MATDSGYFAYIWEQLSGLADAAYRPMMGEYILYCAGKVVGGVYDNRLLVKPTPSAEKLMPQAPRTLPYEGAKPMLLVEEVDDRAFLSRLMSAVAADLSAPASRRRPS